MPISVSLARTSFSEVTPKLRTDNSSSAVFGDELGDRDQPQPRQALPSPHGQVEIADGHFEQGLLLRRKRFGMKHGGGQAANGEANCPIDKPRDLRISRISRSDVSPKFLLDEQSRAR